MEVEEWGGGALGTLTYTPIPLLLLQRGRRPARPGRFCLCFTNPLCAASSPPKKWPKKQLGDSQTVPFPRLEALGQQSCPPQEQENTFLQSKGSRFHFVTLFLCPSSGQAHNPTSGQFYKLYGISLKLPCFPISFCTQLPLLGNLYSITLYQVNHPESLVYPQGGGHRPSEQLPWDFSVPPTSHPHPPAPETHSA